MTHLNNNRYNRVILTEELKGILLTQNFKKKTNISAAGVYLELTADDEVITYLKFVRPNKFYIAEVTDSKIVHSKQLEDQQIPQLIQNMG